MTDEGPSYESTIMEYGAGYLVEWHDLGIRVELSYVDASSKGDVSAYMTWQRLRPNGRWVEIEGSGKCLLTGPQARTTTAKAMRERHGDMADWQRLVEMTSVRLVRALREGQPPKKWSAREGSKPIKPVSYLVDTFIPQGVTTVAHSDPQKGKSVWAQALCASIASGVPFANQYEVRRSGPVLYLDWETDWDRFERRMSLVLNGMGLPQDAPLPIIYRRMKGSLVERLGQIKRLVDDEGVIFIVIDSLMWATADDPNNPERAIAVMETARDLDSTVLALAHQSKGVRVQGRQAAPATIFGSVFYEAAARQVWHLDSQDIDTGKLMTLRHMKANDSRRVQHPIGLALEFEPDAAVFRPHAVQSSTRGGGLAAAILKLLNDGSQATADHIAEAVRADSDSVRKVCEKLVGEGQLMRTGGGRGRGNAAIYTMATTAVPAPQAPLPMPEAPKDIPNPEREAAGMCALCDNPLERYTTNLMGVCEGCAVAMERQAAAISQNG